MKKKQTYRITLMIALSALLVWMASAQAPQGRGEGRDREKRSGERGDRRNRDSQRPTQRESGETVSRQIGLIKNAPGAFDGYTLFAPKHFLITYLINNEGQMVNSWTSQYEPGQSVYLLENWHLLHCCFTKNRGFTRGGEGGRLEEYDWEGNLVWEFDYSSDKYLMHHDVAPMPNGNILAKVVEKKTFEECVAAGFNPNSLRDRELLPDYVIEIEPTPPRGGKIVWEWHVWDHLIQDNDPAKANYGDPAKHPELIDVDVNGRGAAAFWNHMNSIDYNSKLDQIMLSVRGCSELWIIDHSTTTEQAKGHTEGRYGKGGDLIYRWGNPQAYGAGTSRDKQLFQQHDTQWIKEGLFGAGNILIFNNGLRRLPPGMTSSRNLPKSTVGKDWGYSSVDEILPPVDEKGNYRLDAGRSYGPAKPLWTYAAPNPTDFFAEAISGAQRLPNGNTLICDGTSGVLFEVTPKGETVWEYVCPVAGEGPLKQGDPIPLDNRNHAMNAVFKTLRYAPDYPGLKGKDLTPKGDIVGSTPKNVPENLSRKSARDQGSRGGGERQGTGRKETRRRTD